MSDFPIAYVVVVWVHNGCAHWHYFFAKDNYLDRDMVEMSRRFFAPRLDGEHLEAVIATEPLVFPQRRIVSQRRGRPLIRNS